MPSEIVALLVWRAKDDSAILAAPIDDDAFRAIAQGDGQEVVKKLASEKLFHRVAAQYVKQGDFLDCLLFRPDVPRAEILEEAGFITVANLKDKITLRDVKAAIQAQQGGNINEGGIS